jgi:hypothetical protein
MIRRFADSELQLAHQSVTCWRLLRCVRELEERRRTSGTHVLPILSPMMSLSDSGMLAIWRDASGRLPEHSERTLGRIAYSSLRTVSAESFARWRAPRT